MIVYIDTGIFIDYLIGRGHAGPLLRTAGRRGRLPAQLGTDGEECLKRIALSHTGITLSLTCYEVEEAMYAELRRSAKGVTHGAKYVIPAARAVITQTLMTIDGFGLQVADLTQSVVVAQCQHLDLQMRGVRAADALHVTAALAAGADLLLSADDDVLALDSLYKNSAGNLLRCVDSEVALTLL